ncbi:Exodeoxyribonuclease 7 large subunit, partial [Bienertia sinuspersici]
MSSSTSRKRPKSAPKTPNFNTIPIHSQSQSVTSSSTLTSLLSEVEPPPNLLPSKSDFLKLIAVIIIAAFVAAFCNFIFSLFTRTSKPFCDSGSTDYDVSFPVADYADSCEPCPSNGRCFNGHLECIQGFRKYGKLCIEDGDIYEAAKKLSGWAKDHLCEVHAQYMCDGTGAIWVSENNLKNMLDKHGLFQGSTADDVKYVFSKERAMEDINGVLDTRTNSNGVKEYKCPDVLAESYKPITCRARQWVANNLLLLLAVFAQLAGFTTLVLKFWRKRYLTKRAEHLYHQVCDTLEDNALMSKSMGDREPWLIASRLRDHLLTPKERRDPLLWKMV